MRLYEFFFIRNLASLLKQTARLIPTLFLTAITAGMASHAQAQSFSLIGSTPDAATSDAPGAISRAGNSVFFSRTTVGGPEWLWDAVSSSFTFQTPVFGNGISSDGTTLFGQNPTNSQSFTYDPLTNVYNSIIAAASSSTNPIAISSTDGTVFGTDNLAAGGAVPYSWTLATGVTTLSYPGFTYTVPTAISQDGTIVYGAAYNNANFTASGADLTAFRWTSATGIKSIGSFYPTGCSDAGTVVVGMNSSGDPVLWNGTTVTQIGSFNVSSNSPPVAVSPDGTYASYNHSSEGYLWEVGISTDAIALGAGTSVIASSNNRFPGTSGTKNGYYQVGYTNGTSPGFVDVGSVLNSYGVVSQATSDNLTFDGTGYGIGHMSSNGTAMYGSALDSTTGKTVYWYAQIPLTASPVSLSYTAPSSSSESTTLTVSASQGVLSQDVNAFGATAVLYKAPAGDPTMTLSADGSFSYTPSGNYGGNDTTDSFQYYTQTLGVDSAPTTVTLYFTNSKPGTYNGLDISIAPTVVGGSSATATIGFATSVSTTATVSATNATLPGGSSVSVSGTSASFAVDTSPVSTSITATVTVTVGSVVTNTLKTATASFTIEPPLVSTLKFSPAAYTPGGTTTGTVTLTGNTAAATTVALAYSSNTTGAASVTVAQGAKSATFTVTMNAANPTTQQTITATTGATSVSSSLAVNGLVKITSLTVSPTSVIGGVSSVATVTLLGPVQASAGEVLNVLATGATAPSTVTVPEGQTSTTFNVATQPVASVTNATITASNSTNSQTATLTINPPSLTTFTVSPTSVLAGGTVTGTVNLNGAAPTGGLAVSITYSANTSGPATVTVPVGTTSLTFTISTTSPAVTASQNLSAKTTPTNTASASLTITVPTVSQFTINPNSVIEQGTATGTVTLSGTAATPGVPVSITYSANTSGPATVTVPANQTSQSFTVTAGTLSATATQTLTATTGSVSQTASLTITVPTLTQFSISPSSVTEGGSVTGSVMLSSGAPSGGLAVSITYSANTTGPASVTVPANATSQTFTIATTDLPTAATQTLTATLNSVSQTASLTIVTPIVTSISPNSRTAGTPGHFYLSVYGVNFPAGASITWNGTVCATTYNSSTSLTTYLDPSLVNLSQTTSIPVGVQDPDGALSNTVPFLVTVIPNPVPAITSISPNTGYVGEPDFTLTVNGSGFIGISVVKWNGLSLPTTYVSSTELTATVSSATYVTHPGTAYSVTVVNSAPGGGTSNAATFMTDGTFHLAVLYPDTVVEGSATFTMKCTGEGFVAGSVVSLGGSNLATTFVSANEVDAVVPASLLTKVKNTTVVVTLPDGNVSNSRNFYVTSP